MEIKSSKPIPLAEAKDILAERSKDSEMGYEQSQALENMERYTGSDLDKVKKLVSAIMENKKISKEAAIKIVDIGSDNPSTIKAILSKDKTDISEEEMQQIIKDIA